MTQIVRLYQFHDSKVSVFGESQPACLAIYKPQLLSRIQMRSLIQQARKQFKETFEVWVCSKKGSLFVWDESTKKHRQQNKITF